MSVWFGEVIVDGAHVGYFHYNNTGDSAYEPIVDDPDDALSGNGGGKWDHLKWTCDCGQPPVEATLFEGSLGTGTLWEGTVCLQCRVIVEGVYPLDYFLDNDVGDDDFDTTSFPHPEHTGECVLAASEP